MNGARILIAAPRQYAYRQRQIKRLGLDEVLRREREKAQAWRDRQKARRTA